MYTSRLVRRMDSAPTKTFQVVLQYFKKINIEPIFIFSSSQKQQPCHITLQDKQNNVLLATAFLYMSSRLANRQLCELEKEVNFDMKQADLTQLCKTPEEYNNYMHIETLTAAVLCALQKLGTIANESNCCLASIKREFGELLNMFPFLKFALIVWLRCKALSHFKQMRMTYLEAMGNEAALLANYTTEVRGVPLEIICNALNVRLELIAGRFSEQFGRMTNQFETTQHHIILKNGGVVLSEPGESDLKTETTTAWSGSQSQIMHCKNTKSMDSEMGNIFSIESPIISINGESSTKCIKCQYIKYCRCAVVCDRKPARREARSPKSVLKPQTDKSNQAYSNRKNPYRQQEKDE